MLTTDKLPPGSVPRYRIMTKKSILGFGKFADLTVGDVLKVDPIYIVWLYYCTPNCSFCAEILEELGLIPIDKPGTSQTEYKAFLRRRSEGYTPEERMHGWAKIKAKRRAHAVARMLQVRRDVSFSKGELQGINHGRGAKKPY